MVAGTKQTKNMTQYKQSAMIVTAAYGKGGQEVGEF